jgi:ribosome-binding protein aMBF1 (putative translation factor)
MDKLKKNLKQKEKRNNLRHELYAKLDTDGESIQDTCKSLRKILGWDQVKLAQEVRISLSALRRIEQGHQNVRLDTIAKILGHFKLRLVVKRSQL